MRSGREVGRAPEELPGPGERLVRVNPFRDAEVGHLPCADAGVEDVRRLHVAVDDPELVRRRERSQDLKPDVAYSLGWHPTVGELVPKRPTGQPLHHDERTAVLLAGVEDPDDVRMAEASGEAGLRHDPLPHAVLLGQVRAEQLESDLPVEAQIMGSEDLAHAAVAEPLAEPVAVADGLDLVRRGASSTTFPSGAATYTSSACPRVLEPAGWRAQPTRALWGGGPVDPRTTSEGGTTR